MPAGWKVHVVLFAKTGYSGKRIRLGSSGKCTPRTSDVEGVASDLNFGPGQNWNNRARSFVTRNRCDAKLFSGRNFTGKRTRYLDHSLNLANQGLAGKRKPSSYKWASPDKPGCPRHVNGDSRTGAGRRRRDRR